MFDAGRAGPSDPCYTLLRTRTRIIGRDWLLSVPHLVRNYIGVLMERYQR